MLTFPSLFCQRDRAGIRLVPAMGLLVGAYALWVPAQKVLMYDEEKGIIFVDKSELKDGRLPPRSPALESTAVETVTVTRTLPASRSSIPTTKSTDIHVGREKDPPEVYFSSGLEYFKNHDFDNALMNFEAAFKRKKTPDYLLWIGKCQRQMGRSSDHLATMRKILKNYSSSDVADDALFEIAFSYQASNNYEAASVYYSRLVEQFPFGTSYSSGEEFREVARAQKRNMRAEMISALKLLGYAGNDLKDLYASFQKNSGLHPTGLGDSSTVRRIKEHYQSYLERQENGRAQIDYMNRRLQWAYVTAGVLALLCGIQAWNIFSARHRLETLNDLEQTLLDLDTHTA